MYTRVDNFITELPSPTITGKTYSKAGLLPQQKDLVSVAHHFDGRRHFSVARWLFYTNPQIQDVEGGILTSEQYRHRDILNRITYKPKDVLRYISPTYGKPVRAVVQVTAEGAKTPAPDWRRTTISGNAPWVLRMSSWALEEFIENGPRWCSPTDYVLCFLKVVLISPMQLMLISFPIATGGDAKSLVYYKGFEARCWEFPKHARNPLDAQPDPQSTVQSRSQNYDFGGNLDRLLRPRRLVVHYDNGWVVQDAPPNKQYMFISFSRVHFNPHDPSACQPLYRIAEHLTENAGLDAYWMDHLCITPEDGAEKSDDIHRICDVIRGAYQVCVALPSLQLEAMCEWGQRIWTLPEALLADNKHNIKFCASDMSSLELSKVALVDQVWGADQIGRLLAENFSGGLTLSRLELIKFGLEALLARKTKALYLQGDIAYALMGLLGHRPKANPSDTHFQALARLSLANDSDSIVERMICMLPERDSKRSFQDSKFVLKDQLGANLWDIEPLCQVAGVCDGDSLILAGCRGASIRWKNIPAIAYARRSSWKRSIIAFFLRSGTLWLTVAGLLVATGVQGNGTATTTTSTITSTTGTSTKNLAAICLGIIGLLLTLISPWAVIKLYGGKVWNAAPWLIGFEGVLPIRTVERLTFGNAIGRLSYAASSNLLANRDEHERIGKGPDWIEGHGSMPPVPEGHRLFTLIDTGTMTVSVFTAEKPPSVALIAGREGGMLRVVLCHYERSTATLHKQTVLRMEMPMLDRAGKMTRLQDTGLDG